MYPNVPVSQYAYYCSWTIQVPDNMACVIEILDFQGPDWLIATIKIPTPNIAEGKIKVAPYFRISSEIQPNSITFGQYSVVYVDLVEHQIRPDRGKRHVFLANVRALISEDDSKFTNLTPNYCSIT